MAKEYIAKVGDLMITDADIDRVIASFPEANRDYLNTPDGRERILNQQIANYVMALAAKDAGKVLDQDMLNKKGDFEEQFLSNEEIAEFVESIVITDEEVKSYYEDCKQTFQTQESINAKHILVDSLEKCQEIKAKIDAGEMTFEDAAKEFSTCPSGPDGGDLGFFGRGMMVPEFDEAAFAATMGEVTEPVKTQFGYHLILVTDRKEAGYQDYEEVAEQIRQAMFTQKQNDSIVGKIEALKEKFGAVEIDEASLDRLIAMYPEQHQSYLATEEGRNGIREQKTAYVVLTMEAKEKGRDREEGFVRAMADFECQMLAQMMIEELFNTIQVSEEDAKKYYEVTISAYREEENVKASHILVDSLEKCQEIKAKIDAGETTFEDAAKEFSTCPSGQRGGDLGNFGKGQMVPEFDEAAFAAELGVVSEPVQTQFGYHLIKVMEKNPETTKSFEEVKDQILAQLTDQNKNEAYFTRVEELKAKYGVELA